MAKMLNEFIKSAEDMSTKELEALVQKLRKNKYTDQPAAKARKSKTGKSALEKLRGSMSKADLLALLQQEE